MATSDMPLANEVSVVQYLRNLMGAGTNAASASQVAGTQQAVGGTATGGTATAAQAPELTQDQLSSIMTEWLRGNGQFLDNMRQQNVSGLYNTSTQKLVANDLTAQAALKAATANQEIQKTNAALATNANIATANNATSASQTTAGTQTQASVANANNAAQAAQTTAKLGTDVSLANAKAGVSSSRSDTLINTALAGLLNAYKGYSAQSAKDEAAAKKKQAKLAGIDTSGITEIGYSEEAAGAMFDNSWKSAQADTDFLLDPNFQNSQVITDPSYDFGSSVLQSQPSGLDIPELSTVDMGSFAAPTVMDFGQSQSFETIAAPDASSYDFTPVDYTDSDYYSGGGDSWEPISGGGSSGPTLSFDDDEFEIGFSWNF